VSLLLKCRYHAILSGMTAYAGGSPNDGDPVKQWDDISGNGLHLTASDSDASLCPAYSVNGFGIRNQPCISSDGVNDRMRNLSINFGTNPIFVVAVFEAQRLQSSSAIETIAATKNGGTTSPGWALNAGNGYTHTQFNFFDDEYYDGAVFGHSSARYFNGNNSIPAGWPFDLDQSVVYMCQLPSHADGGQGLRLFELADNTLFGKINLAELRIYTGTATSGEIDAIWNEIRSTWNYGNSKIFRLAAGSDDAVEQYSNGNTWHNGGNIANGYYYGGADGRVYSGNRFNNVLFGKGTPLRHAIIYEVCNTNSLGVSPTLGIYGEAADNAGTYNASNYNISSRPYTTASVTWSSIMAWYAGRIYKTPELKTVVGEILARSGWASGNAMAFKFNVSQDNSNYPNRFNTAYDTSPGSAPYLWIEDDPTNVIVDQYYRKMRQGV